MKKIDFRKPRYALPIICFPFLLLFFYIYKTSIGKDQTSVVGIDSLQTGVANVSSQVKQEAISNKLDAFRNRYKQADGYTAVGGVLDEEQSSESIASSYNEREKQMLDSIEKAIKGKYPQSGQKANPSANRALSSNNPYQTQPTKSQQDQALAIALSKIREKEPAQQFPRAKEATDPMQLFRAQMALVDSIGKANDPQERERVEQKRQASLIETETKNKKQLLVSKVKNSDASFNSLFSQDKDQPISAIIDQDITGFSGSKLRIRLLDDVFVGNFLIKKGTYLYAIFSGFSAQRVSLTITSIFYLGNILPVHVLIYDNDGMPGLYVPSSAFRELTRDLGGSSSQGITLQQQAENNNQLVMGILSKMFQSTTTAVNRMIRSNKAKIKYNTQVYLIDTEELKRKQQSY